MTNITAYTPCIAKLAAALVVAFAAVYSTYGQSQPKQVAKPPVAQTWIDVATFSGMGIPMSAGASPMTSLAGLLGGGRDAENTFGMTQSDSSGRWVDVTLMTRNNPNLLEALQHVPHGFGLAPTLKLQAPKGSKAIPTETDDDKAVEPVYEKPKGKLYLYWGCGEEVHAGQPRVLDMATATPADLAKFFVARGATRRGAHSAAGRPVWPSQADARMVPAGASLAGEHAFSGQGVPEGFRFSIPAVQDMMPAIDLAQREAGGATVLEWKALPTARAYFISAMGARGGEGDAEMVIWTSSEAPETGFGLMDYQTNAAVDRWLVEKVLLQPSVTRCAIPKGIFNEAGMLRMIAYGSELHVAHPPRPKDPKVPWEPQWAAQVRVKSVANVMLDMPSSRESMDDDANEKGDRLKTEQKDDEPNPLDLLRGILGR